MVLRRARGYYAAWYAPCGVAWRLRNQAAVHDIGRGWENQAMLIVWMLFGVLVAGPLLVLGALALANSDRATVWLGRVRRCWLPSPITTPLDDMQSATDQAADATAPADGVSMP